MQAIAGSHQQQAVGLLLRVARRQPSAQQLRHALALHRQILVDDALLGFLQNLGQREAGGRRDDADGCVAVGIHETQRAEAVEPRVGCALDDRRLAVRLDLLFQRLHRRRLFAQFGAVRAQHPLQPGADLLMQLPPRRAGEFLQKPCIHVS